MVKKLKNKGLEIFTLLIIFLQLENSYESVLFKIFPIILLLLCFFKNYTAKIFSVLINFFKQTFYIVALILVLMIGLIRNNLDSVTFTYTIFQVIYIALFVLTISLIIAINFAKGSNIFLIFKKLIIMPFLLLAIVNFILFIIGFKNGKVTYDGDLGTAVILSKLGINIQRVLFPFSGGFNNYSSVLGAIFCICLVNLIIIRKDIKFNIFACSIFLFELLMSDSRAAVYYPILIVLILFLFKNLNFYFSFLRFIPILGPFLLMAILPILGSVVGLEFLSRSSEDLETGNSRFLIWGISLSEFIKFKIIHLIGYGNYGHYGSGASLIWSSIFANWEGGEMKTPHNTMWSILFDYGYIGLFLYIKVISKMVKGIIQSWSLRFSRNLIYISFVIYTVFQGITESLFGYYFQNYLLLFIMVALFEAIDTFFTNKINFQKIK